jgi:trk system potassium uptake protein TrkH
MFLGGCAGATGGSVPVILVLILFKALAIYLMQLVKPRAVIPVRIGDRAIPNDVVASVQAFLLLFLVLWAAGALALSLFGADLVTSLTASAACLGNIGPAFGDVGPTRTYDWMPVPGKLVLVVQMLIGRLAIYTVLVLFFLPRRGMR